MTIIPTNGESSMIVLSCTEYNAMIHNMGELMRKNTELNQQVLDLELRIKNWEGEQE